MRRSVRPTRRPVRARKAERSCRRDRAGDFVSAAIARQFTAEGFTVIAGRRNRDKLVPLVAEIEGAGGRCVGRALDARREQDVTAFIDEAVAIAPLEACVFATPGS